MRTLVGTAALLLVLTGCSDDGGDDPDAAPENAPTCAELTGEVLAEDFDGCLKDGELQTVAGSYDCPDGRSLKVVRDDVGWAFEGGEWHTGSADDALLDCYGGEVPTAPPTADATDEPTEPTNEPGDEPTAGESTDPEPTGAADSRQCADIWVEGRLLPEDYTFCREGGRKVLAAIFTCQDDRRLTAYDDRFYAFLGEEIHSSADEEAYGDAFADCFG